MALEGQNDADEDFTVSCTGIGLGAETDFPGDDQRAQRPFGQVILGGDVTILGPAIHPVGVFPKDVLDALNARMAGGVARDFDDTLPDLFGAPVECSVADRQTPQAHGLGQKRSEGAHEGLHLWIVGKFLLEILDVSQQVGVAVLNLAGGSVVGLVAIDHQVPWESFFAEHLFGH